MKSYRFTFTIAASVLLFGATVMSTYAEGQWGKRRPQLKREPAPSIERQRAPAESPLVSTQAELFWRAAPEDGAAYFRSVAPRQEEVLTARFLPDPHSDMGSVIVINKDGDPWICIGSKEACKDIMNPAPAPPPPTESTFW